jgi:type IV secretory pathway VirB3-like protein
VEGHVSYFHEEQRFPPWIAWGLALLIGIPIVIAFIESQFRPEVFFPSLGVVLIFVIVVAMLLMARLVVDVDDHEIRIDFHLLWPTRHIALDAVQGAHATDYSPLLWGGWGVHYMFLRGWAFNTSGSEGVLLELNSGSKVMIGSQRAKELEDAIARAIAARQGR